MIPEVMIVGNAREGQVSLEIVTWREFLQPTWSSPWPDPGGLLQMTAARREAFLSVPFETMPDDPARLVALKSGQVVGKTDFLPGTLWIDGQPLKTLWSSGTVVAPAFRGQGLGVVLCRQKQALGEITATCGVSGMNIGIYHKLGGFLQFQLPRFVLLFNARPAVVRVAGDSALGRALTPLAQVALRGVSRVLQTVATPSLKGLRVRGLEAMPSAFDELLKPARRVALHRSAAWINWLLQHSFNDDPRNGQILSLIEDANGEPLAYFLAKKRFHATASHRGFSNVMLGSLQDWRLFQPNRVSLAQVVEAAKRLLESQRCDVMEVCLPDLSIEGALRRMGFVRMGDLHMFFKAGQGTGLDLADLPPNAWDLRPAEGDNCLS